METAAPPSTQLGDFEPHRRRLWSIAYRMLGSRDEADDMVQEAYLRWHATAREQIRVPAAWLVTTISRLCIDRLRELRTERDAYVGPWLPEPLVAEAAPPADAAAELASDLSVAFLALLERLAPEERAAFLLREAFDSEYGEIAQVLGKSEVAARQIVSRARARVREARPRVKVNPAARQQLLDGFVSALRAHDREAMLGLLAEEAAWTSDGGGKTLAARRLIRGSRRIAQFVLAVFPRFLDQAEFRPVTVNGEAGLALIVNGRLFSVMAIRTDGVRILDVYNIMNPEKLREVKLEGAAPAVTFTRPRTS